MRRFKHAAKRAFTLYELILVCAMLVLVSGVGLSLVFFIRSYSNRSETNSDLITALVDIREQTDKWFAIMDVSGNEITVGQKTDGDVTKWASCTVDGYEYYIGSYTTSGGCNFVFCGNGADYDYEYTDDSTGKTITQTVHSSVMVECPMDCNFYITEYTGSYVYESKDNVRLRFSVNLPVLGSKYICEVVYDASQE